jgi:hypothetical protein
MMRSAIGRYGASQAGSDDWAEMTTVEAVTTIAAISLIGIEVPV